ncbi:MAG: restriction endonuclease subunit S [Curvibacter lanceolatus]|uniref:restriction endonuclease subunit S n=1 Tax=Curvibacter lanceolatus TaxID=86182 RepID=UPI002355821B|nr:restriction endonuclease subunit S [Curvibacter lanceolatus]MBV5295090.1 restriction endonuclease subunit S [Curvibacter lanceolatus]
MRLPTYEAYKDSGFEWLQRVPSHWKIKRLRFVANLNPSKAELAEIDRATDVSFLPMEAIGDDGSINVERTRPISEVETGYTYFRDGDVTIAKITPCFENGKGALMRGLEAGIGFGTTELIVARPKPSEVLGSFLNWTFRAPNFRSQGEASMYGAGGQKRVPDDFVRDFSWSFPPLIEQSAITAFLDRETAKIDTLIAEQKKLLTLLAEKRQATISRAVTKGLNPDAPMKDSGVEWLGEVPENWEIKQLRHVAKIVRGASPRPAGDPRFFSEDSDGNTPWVTVAEVTKDTDTYLETVKEYLTPLGVEQSQTFESGTLVFTNSGATLGVPKILAIDCCANDGILAFRDLAPNISIVFAYSFLLTTTERLRTEMKQGGGQPNLNTEIVKNIRFALPPLNEQLEIVDFLSQELARLNKLALEADNGIALLKERRSALISAAVTGQIDVRNAVSEATTV